MLSEIDNEQKSPEIFRAFFYPIISAISFLMKESAKTVGD